MSKIVPYKINLRFNSADGHTIIGEFKEEDGYLTFSGSVDKSAQIFVNYVCETFKQRIDYLIENKK